MITLELVIAVALSDVVAMDRLAPALRSDLVLVNPFYRRIVEFADDYLNARRKLPGQGDWSVWLDGIEEQAIRDGASEALGRLLATNTAGYNPEFFADGAVAHLKQSAARVARARLNELSDVGPDAFAQLAQKLDGIQGGSLAGLARLADVDTWFHPPREEEYIPTGFPTLNRQIGGWGKELWMVFADSGMGKSMLLQNFAVAAALRGSRVLHISLELGIKPQIQRYYRQIAQAPRADFQHEPAEVRRKLAQWFRVAQGDVCLMEFPAYGLDHEELKRVIERVNRTVGEIDLLVLDYIDLMIVAAGKRSREGAYGDLGRLTHEARSLTGHFDISVLTASQAVRRPAAAGRLTMRDMGDSYQKVRAVDGLITLNQTEEEEEVHQGRLGLPKVRDGGGRGIEIPLYINRELSVIAELGHPPTVELMRRLGHTQAAPKADDAAAEGNSAPAPAQPAGLV